MRLPLAAAVRRIFGACAGLALALLAAPASTPVEAALRRLKALAKRACFLGALIAAALVSRPTLTWVAAARKAGSAAADAGWPSAFTCCSADAHTASTWRK